MGSRYAAAHARREQRRRQASTRDYLPLAEEATAAPAASAQSTIAQAERGRSGVAPARGSGAPAIAARLPQVDYGYLRGDLIRTAVLAITLFAAMIILSFVIHT